MSNLQKEKKRYLTKDDINSLTHVRVKNPRINIENFPDFLIIGPQRTGTTWLHTNLKRNSRIFMSTPKEIHYFSILEGSAPKKLNNSFHPDISYYLKFFNNHEKSFSKRVVKFFTQKIKTNRVIMRGESSATYALIGKKVINDILILNPNIKIIMLVRNPIERVWSHLKLEMIQNSQINYSKNNKYQNVSEIPDNDVLDFINKKPVIQNSFFSKIIDKWSSIIDKENLFVGNFKDIENCPVNLLNEIHNFLDLDFDQSSFEKTMKRKFNASKSDKIPPVIETLLKERYNDEMNLLRGKYNIDL